MLAVRIVVFVFLQINLAFLADAYADDSIDGEWILEGSVYSNQIGGYKDPFFGTSYWSITFRKGKVSFSSSPFELKPFVPYIKKDGWITIAGSVFKIDFPKENQMLISSPASYQSGLYERITATNFSIFETVHDTIYNTSFGLIPKYRGNFLKDFTWKCFIEYPPRIDRSVRASFILMKDGKVKDVNVETDHYKLRKRRLAKAIRKLEANWVPAMVRNSPVSAKLNLEIIVPGGKTIKSFERSENSFQIGLRYLGGNPDLAVQRFTKAIIQNPNNAKYYYYRAYAYYFLLKENKVCEDLYSARALCPIIPFEIVDADRGIVVECSVK